MKGISVIVCCHNSASRLEPTLRHLLNQKIDSFEMEVILVDNASTDNTSFLARKIWDNGGADFPMHIVSEKRPGLSFARFTGIEQSIYDIIIFCDDDNWLNEDYASRAFETMSRNPEIGMLGGIGEAVPEIAEPCWFQKYAGLYAVGKQSKSQVDITLKKAYVYGAGSIIRKEAFKKVFKSDSVFLLSDRIGKRLISGGDNELGYCLVFAGYKIYYDDKLLFKHFIPESRLDLKYLKRLRKSYSASFDIIRSYQTLITSKGRKRRTSKTRLREYVLIFKKLSRVVYQRLTGKMDRSDFIFHYYAYYYVLQNAALNWNKISENEKIVYENYKILNSLER